MTFDVSRFRFAPAKDFLGVVMQQGRVQLDSDWNEWVAQLARRIQAGTLDTVGRAVVPRETPDGFRITPSAGELSIGRGRIYVDGLLAENHGAEPPEWDPRLAELRGSGPVAYTAQPYYPDPPALPTGGGPHLVYLDVWQREVTHLQDPTLVEQAVGVDTTGRLQTVWQVKVLQNVGGSATCATEDEDLPGWMDVTAPSAGRLTTGTADVPPDPDPCHVPPGGGYKGLENQLYRVEIHDPGAVGQATFKWSRDNGAVATAVLNLSASRDRLVVESVGRDAVLRFSDGDWVEVTDDVRELHGLPGELRRIRSGGGVDDATRTITLEAPLSAGLFPTDAAGDTDPGRHTRLRRWDQRGKVLRADGTVFHDLDLAAATGAIPVPPAGTVLMLEHGVTVSFDLEPAAGRFRAADHWSFAARVADASVEVLFRAPPRGIHHHYARLALVTFPSVATDCRVFWPPEWSGGGCDCSVCVSAEGHNSGAATLQHALDQVKDTGGTVCLGPGTYQLREPLRIQGAGSVRVRGKGWRTVLMGTSPGPVLVVEDSIGVAVENLSLVGTASPEKPGGVVAVRNVLGCELRRLTVLGVEGEAGDDPTAVGGRAPRSAAVSLGGYVLGLSARECVLMAGDGVAGEGERDRGALVVSQLDLSDNVLWCRAHGVVLERRTLHHAETRVAGNLVAVCREAGVRAVGGAFPDAVVRVEGNALIVAGDGIVVGTGGARVEDNDVSGVDSRSDKPTAAGVALDPGLDPGGIGHGRIVGNRILGVRGHGIAVRTRVGTGMIKQNVVDTTGAGAVVMEDAGSAEHLVIENNQLVRIGYQLTDSSVTAVRLLAVLRADVVGNTLDGFASSALAVPSRTGVLAVATDEVRVTGNRLQRVGPTGNFAGDAMAVELVRPFLRADVSGNTLQRRGLEPGSLGAGRWWALRVRVPATQAVHVADQNLAWTTFAADGFLVVLTANRAWFKGFSPEAVSVRGNLMGAEENVMFLVEVVGVDACIFAENHCEQSSTPSAASTGGQGLPLVYLQSRSTIVANNRLRGPGDFVTLRVNANGGYTVLGNVTSGPIWVGAPPMPLPPPWEPLNVYLP